MLKSFLSRNARLSRFSPCMRRGREDFSPMAMTVCFFQENYRTGNAEEFVICGTRVRMVYVNVHYHYTNSNCHKDPINLNSFVIINVIVCRRVWTNDKREGNIDISRATDESLMAFGPPTGTRPLTANRMISAALFFGSRNCWRQ
jgi:hypothetical protein